MRGEAESGRQRPMHPSCRVDVAQRFDSRHADRAAQIGQAIEFSIRTGASTAAIFNSCSEYSYKYTFYTATFEREHVQRFIYAFFLPLGHDINDDVVDNSGTH